MFHFYSFLNWIIPLLFCFFENSECDFYFSLLFFLWFSLLFHTRCERTSDRNKISTRTERAQFVQQEMVSRAKHLIGERDDVRKWARERDSNVRKNCCTTRRFSLWESRPKLSKSSTHSRHEEIHDGFLTSLRSTINVIFVSWPKSKLCFSLFFCRFFVAHRAAETGMIGGKSDGASSAGEWGDDSDDEEFVGCFSTARLILSFPFFHLLSFLRHRTQQMRAEASTVAAETSSTHDGKISLTWQEKRQRSEVVEKSSPVVACHSLACTRFTLEIMKTIIRLPPTRHRSALEKKERTIESQLKWKII